MPDPSYLGDRLLVELGYRAALVLPLGRDTKEVLWFVHTEPNSYTRAHARTLQPVIDLATLAVEHDHLRTLTEERLLGPARGQLYSRLKRYGLTRAKR